MLSIRTDEDAFETALEFTNAENHLALHKKEHCMYIRDMNETQTALLEKARQKDMESFAKLFADVQPTLRTYIYRIVANINDCDDIVHDVFIKAYDNISGFRGEASFKTWVFTIATNHARRIKKNRWKTDTHQAIRALAHSKPELMRELEDTNRLSAHGTYEIKEHIDFCFTCVSNMLRLEEQLVVLLKEIYSFKIKDIALILSFSESKVKHALGDGRRNMIKIFDKTCALVNKKGICNQCSELNGHFNPKQDARKKLMQVRMEKEKDTADKQRLLDLRVELCKKIDPLHASGTELHELFLRLCRLANNK